MSLADARALYATSLTLRPECEIEDVLALFAMLRCERVGITGEAGELLGMITRTSLIEFVKDNQLGGSELA